jgi:murein DD-endopeptidase MepM/ murein hydrolase activator NlpD
VLSIAFRVIGLAAVVAVVVSPAGARAPLGLASPLRAGPAAAGGVFVAPVDPPLVVLTAFRAPPTRYGRGHRGVDLAASAGDLVRASGAGTVAFAGTFAGRGAVSIQHPSGLRTTYEPVTPTVGAGAEVAAGQPIGILQPGHPRCSPAVCLHWGVRLPDGSYLDPMALLRPWKVRLLPWDRPP